MGSEKKQAHLKPEQPKEVSDEDMAKAYYAKKARTVTSSLAKKFSCKNKFLRNPGPHPKKKQQFKKPREDEF